MKIPTSSSILLATLAISSSSSCLAAPTGAGTQDTGMASSPSFSTSSVSAVYPTGMSAHPRSDTIVQRNAGLPLHLESRDNVVTTLLGILEGIPVVGPLLASLSSGLRSTTNLDVNSSGSGQGLDPQQMAAIQQAVDEINRRLGTAPPAPAVASALPVSPPVAAASNNDGSGSSSAYPAGASNSASAPGPTESAASYGSSSAPDPSGNAPGPSAPAAPASPIMPGNPPNSPAT